MHREFYPGALIPHGTLFNLLCGRVSFTLKTPRLLKDRLRSREHSFFIVESRIFKASLWFLHLLTARGVVANE